MAGGEAQPWPLYSSTTYARQLHLFAAPFHPPVGGGSVGVGGSRAVSGGLGGKGSSVGELLSILLRLRLTSH